MSTLDGLIATLETVIEDLDEISLQQLRDDLAAGQGRSGTDRNLVRARRAVEKAATILRQIDRDDGEGGVSTD